MNKEKRLPASPKNRPASERAVENLQKHSDEALKGLFEVAVDVDDIAPDAERDGLIPAAVLMHAKKRLLKAQIPITDDWLCPTLWVIVDSVKSSDGLTYAVNLQMELNDFDDIQREPAVPSYGPVWQKRVLLMVEAEGLLGVYAFVDDLADEFARAYHSANGTQPPKAHPEPKRNTRRKSAR